MVVVGQIARAHGNRGQVIINVETDFPDLRFKVGGVLYLMGNVSPRPCRIASVRFQGGRPVVRFEGIETIGDAEVLAQQELRVPESTLPALPEGTYYQYQLIGCQVKTIAGSVVGTVVDVTGSVGVQRLVVSPEAKSDNEGYLSGDDADAIEVPLADRICVRVEPARGAIVIDPPDGLLELNCR